MSKVLLISEIGNNHFGSMVAAKRLIRESINCGADLIKGQAFVCSDISKNGSMPESFYTECQLTYTELKELIYFARSLGSDMFFSIFSPEYYSLINDQNYIKFSASQTESVKDFAQIDRENIIISIGEKHDISNSFTNARTMHASKYLENKANFEEISKWKGFSDHTMGVNNSIKAVNEYGAITVEKHFTLDKEMSYNGTVFRDTVHAANPDELYKLAKGIK